MKNHNTTQHTIDGKKMVMVSGVGIAPLQNMYRYVAWDFDGVAFLFTDPPYIASDAWMPPADSHCDVIEIESLVDKCPFQSWDDRYLDLTSDDDLLVLKGLLL